MMPQSAVDSLELEFLGSSKVRLGDESEKDSKDYACFVGFNSLCDHADFKAKVTVLPSNNTWLAGIGIIDLFCNLNKAYFVVDIVKDEIRFEI
jgi:hypothetical protein